MIPYADLIDRNAELLTALAKARAERDALASELAEAHKLFGVAAAERHAAHLTSNRLRAALRVARPYVHGAYNGMQPGMDCSGITRDLEAVDAALGGAPPPTAAEGTT